MFHSQDRTDYQIQMPNQYDTMVNSICPKGEMNVVGKTLSITPLILKLHSLFLPLGCDSKIFCMAAENL